jgi:hypothetical protein
MTGHRRELDYFRVGCELEANRNFSVRVVADRASTVGLLGLIIDHVGLNSTWAAESR